MKGKFTLVLFFVFSVSSIYVVNAQSSRQHDEDLARDFNNIAAQNYNDGAYAKALLLYEKAITLNPRAAVFYNNRAAAREKVNDLPGALSDYDTALRIDPLPAVFYSNRAALLIKRNDVKHAIIDYDLAVEKEPKTGFFRQERGKARLAAGDRRGALSDFKSAFGLNPDLTFSKMEIESLAKPTAAPVSRPTIAPNSEGHRIALVIGNSNYANIEQLSNPRRDAELVARALHSAGFTAVYTLIDGTQQQILKELSNFEVQASNSDWAVLYYAGHGAEASGTNYLLPIDLDLKDNIDLQTHAIPLDRILSSLERASTLRLVILDACRSDPFKGTIQHSVQTRVVEEGLASLPSDGAAGVLVAFAAKVGKPAQEGAPNTDSPFAQSLAFRIGQPGVELGKLFRLVRDDVLHATHGKQEPYVDGSLSSADLFIHPN